MNSRSPLLFFACSFGSNKWTPIHNLACVSALLIAGVDVSGNPPKFKYHEVISGVANCPPDTCKPKAVDPVFRLVHNPLSHADNFVPQKKSQPGRRFAPEEECGYCSISMWNNEDELRTFFGNMFANRPQWRVKMGDHVARGALKSTDGVASESSPHFNFYEYEEADIAPGFSLVGGAI